MTEFEGFGPKVHKWFKGLEADNSKEYFAAHRDFFEESVREQMEALLSELSKKFGGEIKMFRQNRDIRFSADKSPFPRREAAVRTRDQRHRRTPVRDHDVAQGGACHRLARRSRRREHDPDGPGAARAVTVGLTRRGRFSRRTG